MGENQIETPAVWKTIIAASTASCLGKIATHPLDTVKAQLQVETSRSISPASSSNEALPAVRRVLARSSFRSLYQGYSVAVLGSLPAGAVYMTTYETLKPKFEISLPRHRFLADFSAGLAAEAISCVFWCPIDVVKERLQVQADMRGLYTYSGPVDAVRQIIRSEGVFGLYRAYGATLVSFGPQTAINLAMYENISNSARQWYFGSGEDLPKGKQKPIPPWLSFACASVSGLTATLVTTPLDLAKLRMQVVRASRHAARIDVTAQQPFNYAHIFDALRQIVRDEGAKALFKGAFVRCAVWVPQTAIFLTCFKSILDRL